MAVAAALPVWMQTAETLIREIAAGRRVPGERLPTERDMAADFGISVGTLRKALADLQQRGLIERRQGSGTYVKGGAEAAGVYAFFRLELADGGGGLPTAEVLSASRDGTRVTIRRLRRVGGLPAAVEEIRLDHPLSPRLDRAELSESLYRTYRRRLGLVIAKAEDRVGVAPAPDWAPATFAPGPGALSGHVDRTAFDPSGRDVERSRTWFDPDVVRYVARLK